MIKAYPVLILFMVLLVPLWLILINRFVHHLRDYYPQQYYALGSPGQFGKANFRNNLSFLKFLFCLEFRHHGDRWLSVLCFALMLTICGLLVIYATAIIWLPAFMLAKVNAVT